MKTIAFFGTEKIELMTERINISVPNMSKTPTIFNSMKGIDIDIRIYNRHSADWIFERFNNNQKIKLEIQVKPQKKLVIINAFISKLQHIDGKEQHFFIEGSLIGEDFVYKDGIVGMVDVWSVS